MRSSRILQLACATSALLLSGCSLGSIDDLAVQGPSVYLKEDEVRKTTKNYEGVRASFYHRAGFSEESPPQVGDKRWYSFIRHGWKHVDVQCQLFLKSLRNAEKSRQLVNSQLGSTADSVRNILNTLRKSQQTLNLVAESIGLLTETVDNIHESLLLRLPSSVVINDVQKRQLTEREKVRTQINRADQHYLSEIGAFEAIGEYLKLCLVHQIEARIPNNLSLTDYVALPDGRVVPVGVLSAANQIRDDHDRANIANAAKQRRSLFEQFRENTKVTNSRTQKAAPGSTYKPKKTVRGGQTSYEKSLDIRKGIALQSRLCVSKTDGVFGPATREAIALYKAYDAEFRNTKRLTNADLGKKKYTTLDGARDRAVIAKIAALSPCPSTYANIYERLIWNQDNNGVQNQRLAGFSAQKGNQKLACALKAIVGHRLTYDGLKNEPNQTEEMKQYLLKIETGAAFPHSKNWIKSEGRKQIPKALIDKLNTATTLSTDTSQGFKLLSELTGLPAEDQLSPDLYDRINQYNARGC